ncbi:protein THEM6-like [Adelges cooleyi]|uniref:protein THEM6-like n=1 Tax=Adelges cooleyi TaxID=133065 RepID=UPI00217F6C61|nr:protein THEM6-like [Adelges cooleyi]
MLNLFACDYYTALVTVLLVLVVLYWAFEVHYFARTLWCAVTCRVFKKYVHVLDTTSYSSACLTTDVDFLLFHMNNSRYLREVDFARTEFYMRTGLWKAIRDKGGLPVQGGTSIRYRRFIRTFSLYSISSRIVYWDQNSIYMEHRFVSRGDDFINAIVHCRNRVINCDVNQLMEELMTEAAKKCPGQVEAPRNKPECPLEIHHWIQANLVSSANLRNSN